MKNVSKALKRNVLLIVSAIALWSSWAYGFLPTPLDSPVVVDYTPTGGSTGLNQGRGTARDSHGWIYAVYVLDNNYLVQLSRSTDNGRTWSRFALLDNPWSMYSNIAIDRGDSIYVDWERLSIDTIGRDIYFSKYNGVSWTPPVNVSKEHEQGGSLESSSLALDGRGMLHLTWLGYGPDIWYSYYTNNVWSTPENVTQGAGSWVASMCADTANNLHLAWQGWEIQYKERSGGVWGPAEQATPMRGGQPCIVTDMQCRPHVTFVDSGYVAYTIRDSSGWIPPRRISDTLGNFASITCDKYGHLYVVWYGPDIAKGKLYYATYDGSAWSPPVRLRDDTANGDWYPRLGFPVSDSGVDLIWTMNNPSGSGYRVMYWRLPLLPVGVEEESREVFKGGELSLNVQNPVHRELQASLFLPAPSQVSLALYDISGRQLEVLDHAVHPSGRYEFKKLLDLPSGVYFLRLEAGKADLTRKVVVIR
jgi:hypothetical protein